MQPFDLHFALPIQGACGGSMPALKYAPSRAWDRLELVFSDLREESEVSCGRCERMLLAIDGLVIRAKGG